MPQFNSKETLTDLEIFMASLVAQGASNKQIADIRKLSPLTVKSELGLIFRKVQCKNRAHLAAMYVEWKMVPGSQVYIDKGWPDARS